MERDNNRTTGGVRPKVLASTGGAAVGVAAGEILVYLLEKAGDLPANVEAAVDVVASAGLALLSGYLKRDRA